ncbi:uncharacterized protein LOC110278702 [Arachis duranensis]|uniref:Uncharacterized protein LOC110278702 n=1 Tax=Arachis duranensis TaxID=130453 RepID=A0A6P5N814_ARADU|nr:uncharacterized protein LOC110278702 [Arachis duranensis]
MGIREREAERILKREIKRRRELEDKLSKLESNLQNKDSCTAREDSPLGGEDLFFEDIMWAKFLRNFKSPNMNLYDGTTDPKHHLSNFKSQMYLADGSDATRCKAFPTTLTKAAMKWFDSLPPKFSIQKDKVKYAPSLLGVKQEVGEPLREYMERFNKACLEIQDLPNKAVIMGLVNALREGPSSQSISKRHPTSLNDIQERAEKYINMEENARLREPNWRLRNPHQSKKKEREPKRKEEVGPEKPRRCHNNTPLRASLVDVYRKICHTEKLPSHPLPPHGSRNKYCEYHKLYRNSKNDCYDLKNVIEKLAREGRLDRYLTERPSNQGKRKRDNEDLEQRGPPPQTLERHVHTTSGGFAGGGLTKSSRKRRLKEVYQVRDAGLELPTISFTKEDGRGIVSGHDDPVVITMILANAHLYKTLVDQGSSADILFKPAFDKLGLDKKELKAFPDTLFGLGDTPIKPLGFFPLHTTFGRGL